VSQEHVLGVSPELAVDNIDRVVVVNADQNALLIGTRPSGRPGLPLFQPPPRTLGNSHDAGSDVVCDPPARVHGLHACTASAPFRAARNPPGIYGRARVLRMS
jgi:hypothetical protein